MKKRARRILTALIMIIMFFSSWPMQIIQVKADDISVHTQVWYYIWTGTTHSITWLGFRPSLVIIKADTAAWAAVFKSSSMPTPNTTYFSAIFDNATSQVVLDSDWFTIKTLAAVNSANVRYTWIAFGNSSCSSNSKFCVGYYIGDGTPSQKITTNFQPDLLWVKRSRTSATWRSSIMPNNYGQFFGGTIQNTIGAFFTTIDSDWFTVGTSNNANLGIYYYVAFKNTTGRVNVGMYTGNATDNRNISGIWFRPNWVFIKNSATATASVYNTSHSYWDNTSFFSATANAVNYIQELQTNGFQVWSNAAINGSWNVIYWSAFWGVPTPTGNGKFTMKNWFYTWSGSAFSISDLGFNPDLVIIKHNDQVTDQYAVFRTRIMPWNSTAYFANAMANFAGGITSLNTNWFSIGTHATVNTLNDTYYWTAFGNARNPDTNSWSNDFVIGAYIGNGIDNRDISYLPFQPDLITIKSLIPYYGVWRTSEMIWDFSNTFGAVAWLANNIQQINSDGFQIGNSMMVNRLAFIHWWFAFKQNSNFTVNTYIGDWWYQSIGSVGFQPDLLWVKSAAATQWILRTSLQTGDKAQPFTNIATIANGIRSLDNLGFTTGTGTETNSNSIVYRYTAWRLYDTIPPVLSEITGVPALTNDNTPNYTFSSTESGTMAMTGGCSSTTTNASLWNNTITLDTLPDGTYSSCTITVQDDAGNVSSPLPITSFVIDTTPPPIPTATPTQWTYTTGQNITLISSGASLIYYTTGSENPTCFSGILYSGGISISSSTTIKTIACDDINNSSSATFTYTISAADWGGWGWWGWWGGGNSTQEDNMTQPIIHNSLQWNIQWSVFSTEYNNAYLYAYQIGITTMSTIQSANIDKPLIRAHMAKMMVNYAMNVLHKTLDVWTVCAFGDVTGQSTEMKNYITQSCQLWLMWVNMTGFDPNTEVTRAQFGTALSRALYDNEYNENDQQVPYYLKHLDKLKSQGIIKNTDPNLKEMRWNAMLMIMRASQK